MSTELPMLNKVGMPPPGRSIHRRRAQIEAEAAERGETTVVDSRRQLVLSIIAFGAVLAIGLVAIWLVF